MILVSGTQNAFTGISLAGGLAIVSFRSGLNNPNTRGIRLIAVKLQQELNFSMHSDPFELPLQSVRNKYGFFEQELQQVPVESILEGISDGIVIMNKEHLGIDKTTLWRKMKKYKIEY
ncbi:MAG: hypothetical protein SCH71_07885 [Desulfobulbaceae bacterium]|nr:hypothetical protein [Desulfobulbaceae bacterium]